MARVPADRRWVSIAQAAEEVGVKRRTIYQWMERGLVEYRRTASGNVRIAADTLWRGPEAQVQHKREAS